MSSKKAMNEPPKTTAVDDARTLLEDEQVAAVRIANQLLDVPYADPDDDLRMLSRQLMRRHEELAGAALIGNVKACFARCAELEIQLSHEREKSQEHEAKAIRFALAMVELKQQLQEATEERDLLDQNIGEMNRESQAQVAQLRATIELLGSQLSAATEASARCNAAYKALSRIPKELR